MSSRLRQGSLLSRIWGALALVAFALALGGAVFDACVIVPLRFASPPESVVAWAAASSRPDASTLLSALAGGGWAALTIAWLPSLTAPGSRRWWLGAAEILGAGLLALIWFRLVPLEKALAAATQADGAMVAALAAEWIQYALARGALLAAVSYAAYRAHLAGFGATSAAAALGGRARAGGDRTRRGREFDWGDEETFGERPEEPTPRQRWQGSLRSGRSRS